jgi:hypothetical protein
MNCAMESQPVESSASQDISRPEGIVQDDDFHTGRYSDLEYPPSRSQEVPQDDGGAKEDAATNAKVALVVAALTLTSFLVMLDMSILPTVGKELLNTLIINWLTNELGHPANHNGVPFPKRYRLVR